MADAVLPDFRKFLSERELMLQNQIPFYAPWVSKFLAFSNKRENIQSQRRIAEWQVKQADAPNSPLDAFYTNERKGN